ncbi:hypothetical protein [Parasphingorhabdus flavimaris]|uniref:hypothetical protein n=1 Tax=Parasphingorhabdus flavimaris TaxID=266812 RepID=UPI003003817F
MATDQPISTETLYINLKDSIERLTWTPEQQVAYLDSILGHMTEAEDASGYGNVELALELEDNLVTIPNILDAGFLEIEAVDSIKPLDTFLGKYGGQENADFWARDALYHDERWNEVRKLARTALTAFRG